VKHFSEESWAELARNLVSGNAKMVMQQHLEDGCKRCEATFQMWQSALLITGSESLYTPPMDVVRVVKSQFVALTPEAFPSVRLLFDSNLEPATAGLRGVATARQFLFETDEYYIDLRLEPRRESERACLVGQILIRSGLERAAKGVSVRLLAGKRAVAETATNQFGEFQFEFDAANDLCIAIHRENGNLVLPLYGVQVNPPELKDLQ